MGRLLRNLKLYYVMNKHFCNVGEELQAQIPDSNGAFHNYLPDRIEQTFFLMPTTTEYKTKFWN